MQHTTANIVNSVATVSNEHLHADYLCNGRMLVVVLMK